MDKLIAERQELLNQKLQIKRRLAALKSEIRNLTAEKLPRRQIEADFKQMEPKYHWYGDCGYHYTVYDTVGNELGKHYGKSRIPDLLLDKYESDHTVLVKVVEETWTDGSMGSYNHQSQTLRDVRFD